MLASYRRRLLLAKEEGNWEGNGNGKSFDASDKVRTRVSEITVLFSRVVTINLHEKTLMKLNQF